MVIKLEIDTYFIYLPERFKKVPDYVLNKLNNQNYELSNIGKQKNTFKLIFSNIEATEGDDFININIDDFLTNFSYKPNYYNDNQFVLK